MPDVLAVINRVIEEHRKIREHVRLAGDSLNDMEALFALQKQRGGWGQSSVKDLDEKQGRLQQAVSFLEQGLKNHFGFEEELLFPLFGELMEKAFLREHRVVRQQMESARTAVVSAEFTGLSQRESLSKKSVIQQMVNSLGQAIEEHAGHEEVILDMVKKTLEGG